MKYIGSNIMQLQSIKSIKKLGIQNTLDFEIDHKDHNFYAEGILVSNSHSYGVSYLSALTIYLKYKYPLQFYLSCLNLVDEYSNKVEHIRDIQGELSRFGIKLLGPHLIKSELDFKIDDGNIRFGLKHIKGIADKTIQKVLKFRGLYQNKFEIFEGADEAGLGIGHLSSLIQAGCLDDYHPNRSLTVFEAQVWNLLTEREKKFARIVGEKFNYDLIKIIPALNESIKDDKGKIVIKSSRRETLRKNAKRYQQIYNQNSKSERLANYFYEKKLLGFSHSIKLKDIFIQDCPDLMTIQESKNVFHKEHVHFAAEVIDLIEKKAKNSDTKYLKYKVYDETGQIDVLIFNEKIDIHKAENNGGANVGSIVVINGYKNNDAVFAKVVGVNDYKIYTKLSELNKNNLDEQI